MRLSAGSVPCGALALLAACSAPSAPPPPAPVTVVALPAPAPPAAPSSAAARAAPPASEEETDADAAKPASPFTAGKAAGMDTPPFTAKFAAVFRSAPNALPDPFAGDAVMLFAMPVRCEEAIAASESERVQVRVTWKAGQRTSFTQVAISNGEGRRHAGTIEVLDAPATRGARGKLRVDPGETGNVGGGTIDALVCE